MATALKLSTHDPMTPRICEVRSFRRETVDVFTLEIESGGIDWQPGQFNMVGAIGSREIPISISGDPARTDIWTHTIREVGNCSRALAHLRAGDSVLMRGPFGVGWPEVEAEHSDLLVVSGGVGLVPLMPTLYLASRRPALKTTLIYGSRSPCDVLFSHRLAEWSSYPNMTVRLTVDHPDTDWHHNVGLVTRLIPTSPINPFTTIALICGPEVMMRFTARELLREGISPRSIYVSMERNMKCGMGLCGHCQLRGEFVCLSGPVYPYDRIARLMEIPEL
ncbi:MAG: FAD/NAD(P)-binding protein [Armatimonadetes bacterium]|nr:FAD/NAD(P)-binding protein [Armatimonadota bacterium]